MVAAELHGSHCAACCRSGGWEHWRSGDFESRNFYSRNVALLAVWHPSSTLEVDSLRLSRRLSANAAPVRAMAAGAGHRLPLGLPMECV